MLLLNDVFTAVMKMISTVGFGDSLQLVLLLDGVTVGRSFGCVDQLVGETFGDGLDVSEGGFPGAGDEEPNGLIHPAQRRHVDGLTPHRACSSDTSRVFPRTAVDDSIGHDLQRVFSGEQMDDFESVFDDANRHQLLSVVPPVHHQRVGQALHDRTQSLPEPLGGVSAGGVGEVLGELLLDGDVIRQTDVVDHHIVRAPLIEQLYFGKFLDRCSFGNGDLFIPVVRHCYFVFKWVAQLF